MNTITKVEATNFKHFKTMSQDLENRVLVLGPNGSGKSARTQAIQLAVLGFVPGIDKKNQDIFRRLAGPHSGSMSVTVTVGGQTFSRTYRRASSGSVSCELRMNGGKTSSKDFDLALGKTGLSVGTPADFLALSDSGKLDFLARIFPSELLTLQNEITRIKDEQNALTRDHKGKMDSARSLAQAKSNLELPDATLADINTTIASHEKQLEQLREQRQEEVALAAKREAEAKAQPEIEHGADPASKTEEMPAPLGGGATIMGGMGQRPTGPVMSSGSSAPATPSTPARAPTQVVAPAPDTLDILHQVRDVMQDAGCEACAAMLVLKMSIRKLEAQAQNAETQPEEVSS